MKTHDTIRYIATGSKPTYLSRFFLYFGIFTTYLAIFSYFLTFRSLQRAIIGIETSFFVIYPFVHIYLRYLEYILQIYSENFAENHDFRGTSVIFEKIEKSQKTRAKREK